MIDFARLDIPPPWMPKATLLDVTLRDGGFRTNFHWTYEEAVTIAHGVTAAGAELVELGYLGGVPDLHNVAEPGVTADVPIDLVAEVKGLSPEAGLVAMVHPGAVTSPPDFASYRDAGLEMVRLVYHRSWLERLRDLAVAARSAGLRIGLNLALASRYGASELDVELQTLAGLRPDVLYIADTCAGLAPNRVGLIIATACSTGIPVGFHAHDFLSLALANSIAAADAGATFVDGSIWGIGRGAGNLRSELWLSLQAAQGASPVKLSPLTHVMEMIERKLGVESVPDLASIVSGAFNLTPPQEDQLRSQGVERFGSIMAAAAALADHAHGRRSIEEAFDAAV